MFKKKEASSKENLSQNSIKHNSVEKKHPLKDILKIYLKAVQILRDKYYAIDYYLEYNIFLLVYVIKEYELLSKYKGLVTQKELQLIILTFVCELFRENTLNREEQVSKNITHLYELRDKEGFPLRWQMKNFTSNRVIANSTLRSNNVDFLFEYQEVILSWKDNPKNLSKVELPYEFYTSLFIYPTMFLTTKKKEMVFKKNKEKCEAFLSDYIELVNLIVNYKNF